MNKMFNFKYPLSNEKTKKEENNSYELFSSFLDLNNFNEIKKLFKSKKLFKEIIIKLLSSKKYDKLKKLIENNLINFNEYNKTYNFISILIYYFKTINDYHDKLYFIDIILMDNKIFINNKYLLIEFLILNEYFNILENFLIKNKSLKSYFKKYFNNYQKTLFSMINHSSYWREIINYSSLIKKNEHYNNIVNFCLTTTLMSEKELFIILHKNILCGVKKEDKNKILKFKRLNFNMNLVKKNII